MAFLVTQQGIERALTGLTFSPDTLKSRFIISLQHHFATAEAIAETKKISSETLIREIWQISGEEEIRQKKKNFSSLKSSLNKDLRALDELQNPEGLVLSRENIFEISSEKKDSLLREMGVRESGDLTSVEEFASFKKEFGEFAEKRGWGNLEDIFNELEAQQHQVRVLSQQLQEQKGQIASLTDELEKSRTAVADLSDVTGGQGETDDGGGDFAGTGPAGAGAEDLETIELDEDQVIEEFEQEEEDYADAAGFGPAEAGAEDLETVELDEDQVIEELEQDEETHKRPGLLEALSEYLEAEEALSQNELLTLDESNEDYLKQILQRFTPRFVKIPSGTYIVGAGNPNPRQTPRRRVTLPAFYIGQVPVINDLFDLFVRETGYQTDAERRGYGRVFIGRCHQHADPHSGRKTFSLQRGKSSHIVDGANWRHPHGPDSSLENRHNHPVVQVSRADALAFASWAGKRLPTEEEWEASARGPQGFLFPWGDQWETGRANLESALIGDLTNVKKFSPRGASPFGILDLLGNVFEWTSSRPSATDGSPIHMGHILKGGCWYSDNEIRTYSRLIENDNFWSNTVGFRCAV